MILEKLGASLRATLEKIAKAIFVDDRLINELIRDIQRALLQADVNVQLVFNLTQKIKERIKKERVEGLTKKELLIKIVYEELVKFLGEKGYKIRITEKPFKIMLVGLFGSGKTTTAGKLAKFFTKQGYKVALIGLDTHRPAAMEQIEQIAESAKVPVFLDKIEKEPIKIWNRFKSNYSNFDILIIDTAGRDVLNKELIGEIETLNHTIKPDEILLVISADIGQAALKQAEGFNRSCNITGIVITKMDGTAKAGGALSACVVTGAPVKFIATGEKINDIEEFKPKNFVSRLLGMGDIETLLEKVKEVMPEEEVEDLGKKFLRGEFNLIDLYEQMRAIKKMGPLTKMLELIPGFFKIPKEVLQSQEVKIDKWKYIMQSMTKEELENPDIIRGSRIERIAKGSGTTSAEVRELIKQYKMSKKLIKSMKGRKLEKFMKRFNLGVKP